MVKAFFVGKTAGKKGHTTSDGVWFAYGKGLISSIYVFLILIIVISVVFFVNDPTDFIGAIGWVLVVIFVFSLVFAIIGLIFYTAPAFFGYGIGKQAYVSKLIEIEANKTREEIENDIQRKQSIKSHLS